MAARNKLHNYSGFNLSIGPAYKDGWNRAESPKPAPANKACSNCKEKGHLHAWSLKREVNAFGNITVQTREVLECTYCKNEEIIGALDFVPNEEPKKPKRRRDGKYSLRSLTKEEREYLFQVMNARQKEESKE